MGSHFDRPTPAWKAICQEALREANKNGLGVAIAYDRRRDFPPPLRCQLGDLIYFRKLTCRRVKALQPFTDEDGHHVFTVAYWLTTHGATEEAEALTGASRYEPLSQAAGVA